MFPRRKTKLLLLSSGSTGTKLVENVVVTFYKEQYQLVARMNSATGAVYTSWRLEDQPRSFQEVCADGGTRNAYAVARTGRFREEDFHVFTETGTVVISRGFRVTERLRSSLVKNAVEDVDINTYLHDRVSGQHCLLNLTDVPGTAHSLRVPCVLRQVVHSSEVTHNVSSTLRFTGTTFTTDNDRLILPLLNHTSVRLFGHGELFAYGYNKMVARCHLKNGLPSGVPVHRGVCRSIL